MVRDSAKTTRGSLRSQNAHMPPSLAGTAKRSTISEPATSSSPPNDFTLRAVTVDSYRIAYGYYTKLTRMANFVRTARISFQGQLRGVQKSLLRRPKPGHPPGHGIGAFPRSEEHTSEL